MAQAQTDKVQIRIDTDLIEFMDEFRKTHRLSRSAFISLGLERGFPKAWAAFKAKKLAQIGVVNPETS